MGEALSVCDLAIQPSSVVINPEGRDAWPTGICNAMHYLIHIEPFDSLPLTFETDHIDARLLVRSNSGRLLPQKRSVCLRQLFAVPISNFIHITGAYANGQVATKVLSGLLHVRKGCDVNAGCRLRKLNRKVSVRLLDADTAIRAINPRLCHEPDRQDHRD